MWILHKITNIALGLGLLLLVASCGNLDATVISTSSESTTAAAQINYVDAQIELDKKSAHWITFFNEGKYGYAVFNKQGHEFFRVLNEGQPDFIMMNEDILKVDMSGGNMTLFNRFFNLENSKISPLYWNILLNEYGKVGYMSFDYSRLIIHDIFEPTKGHIDIERDFRWIYMFEPVPEEVTERIEIGCFETIKFLDETHLHISYLNTDMEFVEETIVLPATRSGGGSLTWMFSQSQEAH